MRVAVVGCGTGGRRSSSPQPATTSRSTNGSTHQAPSARGPPPTHTARPSSRRLGLLANRARSARRRAPPWRDRRRARGDGHGLRRTSPPGLHGLGVHLGVRVPLVRGTRSHKAGIAPCHAGRRRSTGGRQQRASVTANGPAAPTTRDRRRRRALAPAATPRSASGRQYRRALSSTPSELAARSPGATPMLGFARGQRARRSVAAALAGAAPTCARAERRASRRVF